MFLSIFLLIRKLEITGWGQRKIRKLGLQPKADKN